MVAAGRGGSAPAGPGCEAAGAGRAGGPSPAGRESAGAPAPRILRAGRPAGATAPRPEVGGGPWVFIGASARPLPASRGTRTGSAGSLRGGGAPPAAAAQG